MKLSKAQEITCEASRLARTGRLTCTFLLRCRLVAVAQEMQSRKQTSHTKSRRQTKGTNLDKTLFLVHTVKAKFSETQLAKATSFSGLQTESKAKPQEKPVLVKTAEMPTYPRTRTNISLVHFVSVRTIPNRFKHVFVHLARRLKLRLLSDRKPQWKQKLEGGNYWAQRKYIDPDVSAWRIDATTHCAALLPAPTRHSTACCVLGVFILLSLRDRRKC